jgi:hypothetical protein
LRNGSGDSIMKREIDDPEAGQTPEIVEEMSVG